MTTFKTRSKRYLRFRHLSRTLISAIRASKGSKLPFLKNLYGILVHLSYLSVPGSDCDDKSKGYGTRSELRGFAMKSDDRENLGELLFKELERRFVTFFSYLHNVSSSSDDERGHSRSEASDCIGELAPLLRCCMLLLTLADPDVALEKTQILLGILERLIRLVPRGDKNKSVTFEKRVSREFLSRDADCTASVSEDYVAFLSITEPPDPCSPFLSTLLEVFADELLMHRLLRELFTNPAARSSLFECHFPNDAMGNVMELISLQFILLLSDKDGSENFLKRLSCRVCNDLRVCEISLTSSLSLLLNPTILSAPKVLQAHLILLVSETLSDSMSENRKCKMSLMGAPYCTTLEVSISLYNRFMSTFLMEGHPIGGAPCTSQTLLDRSFAPFKCHIHEETLATLDDVIARSVSSSNLRSHKVYDQPRPNILADSIACAHECRVDESCEDDIFARIIDSIVLGAFSDSVTDSILYKNDDSSPEDVYLLTALLKLMHVSMSAVIWCLRVSEENSVCLGEASLQKYYDSIANFIGTFQQFSVSLPNQKKLFDVIEANPTKHKTTKWMLLHISGVLSFSFASGFDFLVKNCVLLLAAVMNVYALEGGNLEALQSVLIPSSEILSRQMTLDKPGEVLVSPKICKKIASRIQEMRSGFMSSESRSCFPKEDERVQTSRKSRRESHSCIEEETEETCDGKVFLDCLLDSSSDIPDYDDLADFIECKAGKDYPRWLNDKERHRRWRSKKMAVLRWRTRRKTWKLVKA